MSPRVGREPRVRAIGEVSGAGVPQGGEVDADLVGAPGLQMHLHQRRLAEGFQDLVVGHGGPAVLDDGEPPVVARVASDRRIDGAGQGIRQALDDGVVDLVHGALLEGPLQRRVGVFGLGHHHDAGRADVEPVHDPGPFRRPGRGDPVSGTGEAAHDGGPHPARGRVGCDPHRFVDDNEIIVIQQDLQAFHNFLHDFQGIRPLRNGDFEHGAGGELGRFAQRPRRRR